MIEGFTDKTKMLMNLHHSRLSEKDRRHFAALESLKLGRGGTDYISSVWGFTGALSYKGERS